MQLRLHQPATSKPQRKPKHGMTTMLALLKGVRGRCSSASSRLLSMEMSAGDGKGRLAAADNDGKRRVYYTVFVSKKLSIETSAGEGKGRLAAADKGGNDEYIRTFFGSKELLSMEMPAGEGEGRLAARYGRRGRSVPSDEPQRRYSRLCIEVAAVWAAQKQGPTMQSTSKPWLAALHCQL